MERKGCGYLLMVIQDAIIDWNYRLRGVLAEQERLFERRSDLYKAVVQSPGSGELKEMLEISQERLTEVETIIDGTPLFIRRELR